MLGVDLGSAVVDRRRIERRDGDARIAAARGRGGAPAARRGLRRRGIGGAGAAAAAAGLQRPGRLRRRLRPDRRRAAGRLLQVGRAR